MVAVREDGLGDVAGVLSGEGGNNQEGSEKRKDEAEIHLGPALRRDLWSDQF